MSMEVCLPSEFKNKNSPLRRPWNIIDHPVYSLATYKADKVNMNICTYVMAVSRKPKLYAVSIEHESQTLDNLANGQIAVLQLLTHEQSNLIRPFGLKSGKKYDKEKWLENKGLLTEWQGQKVLKDSAALLLLKKVNQVSAGDHELFIFSVLKSKTIKDSGILMFQDLIEQKIIL